MKKIGNIQLKNKFILAPMAGYTTAAMRRIAAENCAALTVTEMVSVKGLLYNNQKTKDLLKTAPAEQVKCVQLFGREPEEFLRASLLPALEKFDIIDVNMGCPVKKVVGNGEGSALMNSPERAADIVSALKSSGKAVTVKTRLQYSEADTVAFINKMFKAGADMVAIHARTPEQMYRGKADYEIFKRIKAAAEGVLALSGDITDLESLKDAEQTGADFLLIGRGAVANPSIFRIFTDEDGGTRLSEQEYIKLKHTLTLRLFDYMCGDEGEAEAVRSFRKFVPYVLKGERCGKDRRHAINFISDAKALKSELAEIFGTVGL